MDARERAPGEALFGVDERDAWGAPGFALVDRWSRGMWERAEGFKQAAQVLADHAKRQVQPYSDWLLYPVVYNYRHAIELRLKYAILDGKSFLGNVTYLEPGDDNDPDQVLGHDLERLWKSFQEIADECGVGVGHDWSEVEQTVLDLQGADTPSGEAFRYAHGRDGRPLPSTSLGVVRIERLREQFDRVLDMLEAWESALEARRDAIRDSQDNYQGAAADFSGGVRPEA